MDSRFGISIYLSTPYDKNEKILKKASDVGVNIAFTSLNIPEENLDKKTEMTKLLNLCQKYGISPIIDINGSVIEIFSIKDLENMGIRYVRIDDHIDIQKVYELSKHFKIVLNASTILKEEIDYLFKNGISKDNLIACHNFYPKIYTGISEEFFISQNELIRSYGIRIFSFVSGKDKRGPMFKGLPTIENDRYERFEKQVLDHLYKYKVDVVLCGDIDIDEKDYSFIKNINKDIIELKVIGAKNYLNKEFQDRIDKSEYLIRALDSRKLNFENDKIDYAYKKGAILVSNEKFLRYKNELEILKKEITKDIEKRDIVGFVIKEDIYKLDYISYNTKFIFV